MNAVLRLAPLAVGCISEPPPDRRLPVPTPPVPVVSAPGVTAHVSPVDPRVPLVRTASVSCDAPCAVVVSWADEGRSRSAASPLALDHEVPLVGMRPDTGYRAEVDVTDAAGRTLDLGDLLWVTEPLPELFPEVVVRTSDPSRAEPGDTLLGVATRAGVAYSVVLDGTGAVVWYRVDAPRMFEVRLEADGQLLGVVEPDLLVETDWHGRVLRSWHAGDAVPAFHHEGRRTAEGTVLTLTHEARAVTGFPSDYVDPTLTSDADVLVDRVVELTDEGEVVHDHDLGRVLDLRRIGFMSLLKLDGAYDWSHANAVAPHLDDDGLVVSIRHQDAVVELDRQTGDLRWILANPDNWSPELDALRLAPIGSPFEWPYHQHAVEPGEDGRLLMFDNGNARTSPFTGEGEPPMSEMWSRVVEYRVDEEARTVEQLWEFQPPGERLWSGAEGSAERQPTTGNVVSLWGYVTHVDGVARPDIASSVRLIEFLPESGEVVLDLELVGYPESSPGGWNAYRAHRIPAL